MTCDQEFAAFLVANPSYEQTPPLDPADPAYYYKRFACQDGGERFFDAKPLTCQQFATSATTRGYRILNSTGILELGVKFLNGTPYLAIGDRLTQAWTLVYDESHPGAVVAPPSGFDYTRCKSGATILITNMLPTPPYPAYWFG